jgi:flagellar FliL protein
MSDVKKADAPAAAPKKKSKLVLILALAFVVLGGGGAGAYFYFAKNATPPTAEEKARAEEEDGEPGLVELEPFVVNLADPGGQRYVRVSMRLLTATEEQALEVKENAVDQAKLRAEILELLSMQTADVLTTLNGKNALKAAVVEHASHAVHHVKVTDVLFVEFIVQ